MKYAPVMREDDEDRVRVSVLSAGQKRGMRFLAGVQIALIALTWGLLIAQIATSINFGMGVAPTLLLFIVFYLHFTKQAIALRDEGIRVRWIAAMRVWSPILFLCAGLPCLFTIS